MGWLPIIHLMGMLMMNLDFYKINVENIEEQWVHVAYTFNSENTGAFYINGVAVSIGDKITDNGVTGNYDNAIFGKSYNTRVGSSGHFYKGLIDEARWYNRVLSASEIKQLYQPCQPSIDIKLNSNNRVTGDRVVINAQIKGPGGSDSSCEPTQVEQKVWVKLPNDVVIPLIDPYTVLTLLPGDDIDTKIFEYTFSGAEPIGAYQIGGRLLHPFSGDTISTDIDVLTFSQ